MQRCFAFLRAINVGGRTVTMDRLRAVFEQLRLSNVATFIASGNVVFDSEETDAAGLERRIERELRRALGFDVATFVRVQDELVTVAGHRPFEDAGAAAGEGLSSGWSRRNRFTASTASSVYRFRSGSSSGSSARSGRK